jgi:hypothetical protein
VEGHKLEELSNVYLTVVLTLQLIVAQDPFPIAHFSRFAYSEVKGQIVALTDFRLVDGKAVETITKYDLHGKVVGAETRVPAGYRLQYMLADGGPVVSVPAFSLFEEYRNKVSGFNAIGPTVMDLFCSRTTPVVSFGDYFLVDLNGKPRIIPNADVFNILGVSPDGSRIATISSTADEQTTLRVYSERTESPRILSIRGWAVSREYKDLVLVNDETAFAILSETTNLGRHRLAEKLVEVSLRDGRTRARATIAERSSEEGATRRGQIIPLAGSADVFVYFHGRAHRIAVQGTK